MDKMADRYQNRLGGWKSDLRKNRPALESGTTTIDIIQNVCQRHEPDVGILEIEVLSKSSRTMIHKLSIQADTNNCYHLFPTLYICLDPKMIGTRRPLFIS